MGTRQARLCEGGGEGPAPCRGARDPQDRGEEHLHPGHHPVRPHGPHRCVNPCGLVGEARTLLKVAFPVDVLSPRATYHIQFGTIQRATHANDPRDRARFEVTGHHSADLSEGDYGVSLLNDCKYGYDVKENVLRLSLLRSSIAPDPTADEGQHDFTCALSPCGRLAHRHAARLRAELPAAGRGRRSSRGRGIRPSSLLPTWTARTW